MITKLKIQVEQDNIFEEEIKDQLEKRNKIIENLKAEIFTSRKYLHKKNM
jgi:hypothetical protein